MGRCGAGRPARPVSIDNMGRRRWSFRLASGRPPCTLDQRGGERSRHRTGSKGVRRRSGHTALAVDVAGRDRRPAPSRVRRCRRRDEECRKPGQEPYLRQRANQRLAAGVLHPPRNPLPARKEPDEGRPASERVLADLVLDGKAEDHPVQHARAGGLPAGKIEPPLFRSRRAYPAASRTRAELVRWPRRNPSRSCSSVSAFGGGDRLVRLAAVRRGVSWSPSRWPCLAWREDPRAPLAHQKAMILRRCRQTDHQCGQPQHPGLLAMNSTATPPREPLGSGTGVLERTDLDSATRPRPKAEQTEQRGNRGQQDVWATAAVLLLSPPRARTEAAVTVSTRRRAAVGDDLVGCIGHGGGRRRICKARNPSGRTARLHALQVDKPRARGETSAMSLLVPLPVRVAEIARPLRVTPRTVTRWPSAPPRPAWRGCRPRRSRRISSPRSCPRRRPCHRRRWRPHGPCGGPEARCVRR